jgi:hypothetical protein
MKFLVTPSLRSLARQDGMEEVAMVKLIFAERAHVVNPLAHQARDLELVKTGFLDQLPSGGVPRNLSRKDGSGRNLKAGLRMDGMGEEQELIVASCEVDECLRHYSTGHDPHLHVASAGAPSQPPQ